MTSELLTSSKNPLLKEVRRAILKGSRTEDGYCIAETFHLLEEALRSDCAIRAVITAESVRLTVERRVKGLKDMHVIRVPDPLFEQLSATETNQGVMALVRPQAWDLEQLFRGHALVVLLDGVQDPGNAGAIMRAAEAFGASGVIFLKGSVSPYNPKAIRASAGSVFRIPLVHGLEESIACAALEQKRIETYAAMPSGSRAVADADLAAKCAFIIGSEGRGVSEKLQAFAVGLRIPTTRVDSLNAAVAAGILLYEARRQRQSTA
ncbi:MAG: TrmH family RNA methyltransferase [Bryobacteraceae bacterium]